MIPFQYFDAYMNMALDETIMENVRSNNSLPTIRFYGWKPSAISIGYFQGLHHEVNVNACHEAGVDIIRRMTGGGAVYHDTLGEATYSIIAPISIFPQDINESYKIICTDIIYALDLLGIPSSFQPINDIIVNQQKISGNAQTRRGGILLQHGTVLYQVDVERMFSLLNVSEKKSADKLIKSVKKRVTSICQYHNQITMQDLIQAMETSFSREREIIPSDYTEQEFTRARHLAEEKYKTDAWNAMR